MRVLFNTYTFIDLISVVYFRQLIDCNGQNIYMNNTMKQLPSINYSHLFLIGKKG